MKCCGHLCTRRRLCMNAVLPSDGSKKRQEKCARIIQKQTSKWNKAVKRPLSSTRCQIWCCIWWTQNTTTQWLIWQIQYDVDEKWEKRTFIHATDVITVHKTKTLLQLGTPFDFTDHDSTMILLDTSRDYCKNVTSNGHWQSFIISYILLDATTKNHIFNLLEWYLCFTRFLHFKVLWKFVVVGSSSLIPNQPLVLHLGPVDAVF